MPKRIIGKKFNRVKKEETKPIMVSSLTSLFKYEQDSGRELVGEVKQESGVELAGEVEQESEVEHAGGWGGRCFIADSDDNLSAARLVGNISGANHKLNCISYFISGVTNRFVSKLWSAKKVTNGQGSRFVDVLKLHNSNFVAVWEEYEINESLRIKVQIYTRTLSKIGSEIVINQNTKGPGLRPIVRPVSSNFWVIWHAKDESNTSNEDQYIYYCQRFEITGSLIGSVFP